MKGRRFALITVFSALLAAGTVFPAAAETIGSIDLQVTSHIEAGNTDSDVTVTCLSDGCSVGRVDIQNAPDSAWAAGDEPKLYIVLLADEGNSFPLTLTKDSVSADGASVTKVSVNGVSQMSVQVRLSALKGGGADTQEQVSSTQSATSAADNSSTADSGGSSGSSASDNSSSAASESAVTYSRVKGTAGANSSETAEKLFDSDAGTKWCTAAANPYVIFKTSRPVAATGYHIVTGNDNTTFTGRNPKSWVLYGCNADSRPGKDSSEWQEIVSVSGDATLEDKNYTEYYFPLSQTAPAYEYYMFYVTEKGAKYTQMSEFALSYAGSSFSYNITKSSSSSSSSSSGSSSGSGTVSGLLCAACHGSGTRTNGQVCFACGGTGYVP